MDRRCKFFKKKRKELSPVEAAKLKLENKAAINAFKAKGCTLCPEKDICCLDAHHLDPGNKRFNIGEAFRLNMSTIAITNELLKCICICANCHRKLNAGKLQLPVEGTL